MKKFSLLFLSFSSLLFCSESLEDKLTIITTTSPIPSNPSTQMLERTQKSLFLVPELRGCKKIIVFDGVPRQQRYRTLAYELYIRNVQKLVKTDPVFANTTLVINRDFKHLANSLREAFPYVDTPYVFVHQHDFLLAKKFDATHLIASMDNNPAIKLVRFNRFDNKPNHWDGQIDTCIEGECYVPLLRTFGWSDNDHIARVDYYRDFVFPKIEWGGAMEWFLHAPELIRQNHPLYGTYLYGEMNESPYIIHLDGKSY